VIKIGRLKKVKTQRIYRKKIRTICLVCGKEFITEACFTTVPDIDSWFGICEECKE